MADFTLGQAAKRLNVSKPTVAKYIREGKLNGVKNPDGSYTISGAVLSAFAASYTKPTRGKAAGEAPTAKRDKVAVLQAEIVDLKSKLSDLERESAFEAKAAQRDKEYLEREVADQKDKIRSLTRDLEQTRQRLDAAQDQIAAIAAASVERGQIPWWQRLLPGKS